jgi:hypothetical protein
VSMVHQTATPQVSHRPRPRSLVLAPDADRGRTAAKIGALIALTAFGAALAAGAVGLALVFLLSTVSG